MQTLGASVYLLCFAASLTCMVLLVRGYLQSRTRLLLWSALCFVGLAVNNLLLFVDLVIFPGIDLRPYRSAASLIAVSVLLIGFILETD